MTWSRTEGQLAIPGHSARDHPTVWDMLRAFYLWHPGLLLFSLHPTYSLTFHQELNNAASLVAQDETLLRTPHFRTMPLKHETRP
jgi:hypothetical protein